MRFCRRGSMGGGARRLSDLSVDGAADAAEGNLSLLLLFLLGCYYRVASFFEHCRVPLVTIISMDISRGQRYIDDILIRSD